MGDVDTLKQFKRSLILGTEAAMQACLSAHPHLLLTTFWHGSNGHLVVPQFRFGRDYRADFLILTAHSGAVHAVMVELESPSSRPYLADGTEGRSLRIAMRQVRDWDNWIEADPSRFRNELAAEINRGSSPFKGLTRVERNMMREHVLDMRVYVHRHFCIVIGRRATLSASDQERRAHVARQVRDLELATYDRFVDLAQRNVEQHRELLRARRRTAS